MTALRWAAALAALLGAAPAAAYQRTTDGGTGRELAWPVPVVPWHLDRSWAETSPTCEPTAGGDPALASVLASFATWEQSCTDLRLVHAGTIVERRTGFAGTAENLVVFRRGWCSQHPQAQGDPCLDDPDVDCGGIYGCFEDACDPGATSCANWNIVALTSVLYDPGTGRILNADIEVNGWDGAPGSLEATTLPQHGWYFTCGEAATECGTYGQPGCRYMDLQNTVTHEVGHLLGLAHVNQASATMYSNTDPGEISKRTLSLDDVAGVCNIYPASGGGCGCGTGSAGGALAFALLALGLRRAAARRRP